jgi:prostaglandin-E synthase
LFLQESKAAVAPRTICYLVKKAESTWWPRLLKKEGKPPVFLKVDWDKWQDEDDEDAGCKSSGSNMCRFGYYILVLYVVQHELT